MFSTHFPNLDYIVTDGAGEQFKIFTKEQLEELRTKAINEQIKWSKALFQTIGATLWDDAEGVMTEQGMISLQCNTEMYRLGLLLMAVNKILFPNLEV